MNSERSLKERFLKDNPVCTGFLKFRRNLAEKYISASLYFSQACIGKLGVRDDGVFVLASGVGLVFTMPGDPATLDNRQ